MRILLVRVGRAGDIVMTTPAINAILQCYPDASCSLLTSPDGNRLLKTFSPRIDEILVWDKSKITAGLRKRELSDTISKENFDIVFCFETSPSIINLFSNSNAELYTPEVTSTLTHTARIYLNMVEKACGKPLTGYYAYLPVDAGAVDSFEHELHDEGIDADDMIVAFHPTFSGYSRLPFVKAKARNNKLWSSSNFARLADRLAEYARERDRKLHIIIDLLQAEAMVGEEICRKSNAHIRLLVKPPDMERYKALLSRIDLLVTPDTGPMHMAAALDTRIVALFSGKTPGDCGPYMPAERFSVLQAEDFPDFSGINSITVDAVYDACMHQLGLAAGDG